MLFLTIVGSSYLTRWVGQGTKRRELSSTLVTDVSSEMHRIFFFFHKWLFYSLIATLIIRVSLYLLQVLHYLAVQKPADLARHLLPCVIHAAVLKVKEEGKYLIWLVISSFPKWKYIFPGLIMVLIFLKIENLENISSVKKIIKQIITHSSKVLHFPNPEDKKLEVSLLWYQYLAKCSP